MASFINDSAITEIIEGLTKDLGLRVIKNALVDVGHLYYEIQDDFDTLLVMVNYSYKPSIHDFDCMQKIIDRRLRSYFSDNKGEWMFIVQHNGHRVNGTSGSNGEMDYFEVLES